MLHRNRRAEHLGANHLDLQKPDGASHSSTESEIPALDFVLTVVGSASLPSSEGRAASKDLLGIQSKNTCMPGQMAAPKGGMYNQKK